MDRDAAERGSTLVEKQQIEKQQIEKQRIEKQRIEKHVGRGSSDRGARCSLTARSGAPDRAAPWSRTTLIEALIEDDVGSMAR